jgi:hypothetical protein
MVLALSRLQKDQLKTGVKEFNKIVPEGEQLLLVISPHLAKPFEIVCAGQAHINIKNNQCGRHDKIQFEATSLAAN